ncbi:pyruvate dehydrogenase complex E1 component subunit beta [Rickettsiales bacterium]|nr:pyruvate dehydrogenase complex E1 component subunit beta [Rickettsiales bacterium]
MPVITIRQSIQNALKAEMKQNDQVVVLGEEVAEYQGAYKATEGLLQEFGPTRVIDTPITEHGFTGLAVGMAMEGMNPVVEFMTFNFSMQAIDHIINSAAKTLYMSGGQITCPIVFRGPNGIAANVAAQHSQCYASWYAHCPGLIVIAPYDANSTYQLLRLAIQNPNPVIFLEHELIYGHKFDFDPKEAAKIEIGKAHIGKTGSDVTLVGFSASMQKIYEAAEILEKQNISAEVIDILTIKPLDIETIVNSAKKTGRVVTVEEGWAFAGIGSEISAQITENAFEFLDSPVIRVASKDVPLPYAKNLEAAAIPSTTEIVNAARKTMYLEQWK